MLPVTQKSVAHLRRNGYLARLMDTHTSRRPRGKHVEVHTRQVDQMLKHKGWSRSELARRIGRSPSYTHRLIDNILPCDEHKARLMADQLGVPVGFIATPKQRAA